VIKITAALGCTISIGNTNNQQLKGVKYDNESGTPDDVKVTVTVDEITYKSAGCPGMLAEARDGFLTETVTAKALKDEGGKEGVQIGLTQS
jgi:hypothetical protein